MKLKFPFKKVKNVCTTEQVVHQVDGKDKKLSEVLNSVPITINGKSPMEYIEDDLAFIRLANACKEALNYSGLYCLYPNTSVNVKVTMTSEQSADIDVQGVFYVYTSVAIELDAETGEGRVVVGEFGVGDQTPEHIRSFVQGEVGPRVREIFDSRDLDDVKAIFDYFYAQ